MNSPSESAPAPVTQAGLKRAPAAILALVAQGMSVREILDAFPDLDADDVRAALLDAAEVIRDPDASLRSGDRVGAIIREAQRSSGLSEDEAMELSVSETRAVRREWASRRK